MPDITPLLLLQLSDPHILPGAQDTLMGINTEFYWQKTVALAMQNHPQARLMLVTGDLTQHPLRVCYQRILETLTDLSMPCLCLPGNHDDFPLMQQILHKKNVSCDKQVIFDHWQIICLNSQIIDQNGGYLPPEEFDFLAACLKQYPDLFALIAVHHHCLATGSKWMDTMQISNSNELFNLLKQFPKVNAITSGHIHQVMDKEKNGIRIFGVPSTCFQFKPLSANFAVENTPPGYRWFELFPDGSLNSGVNRLQNELLELDIESGGY